MFEMCGCFFNVGKVQRAEYVGAVLWKATVLETVWGKVAFVSCEAAGDVSTAL